MSIFLDMALHLNRLVVNIPNNGKFYVRHEDIKTSYPDLGNCIQFIVFGFMVNVGYGKGGG